jgi:hypothetical protein
MEQTGVQQSSTDFLKQLEQSQTSSRFPQFLSRNTRAEKIVKYIVESKEVKLEISENEGKRFAKALIDNCVDLATLSNQMTKKGLYFSGAGLPTFLIELYKSCEGPGKFSDEKTEAKQSVANLPYDLVITTGTTLQQLKIDEKTPPELIGMLTQKPSGMSYRDYAEWGKSTGKLEVILLVFKNLRNYLGLYKESKEITQPTMRSLVLGEPSAERILMGESHETALEKMTRWCSIGRKNLAHKMYYQLYESGLLGSGYEEAICRYVDGNVSTDMKFETLLTYAISIGRKKLKQDIEQESIAELATIPEEQEKLTEEEQEKLVEFLKALGTRKAKKIFMAALSKNPTPPQAGNDAFLIARQAVLGGTDTNQNILRMIVLSGAYPKLADIITPIAESIASDFESKYNFNPNVFGGTVSRGWHKTISGIAYIFCAMFDLVCSIGKYMASSIMKEKIAMPFWNKVVDLIGKGEKWQKKEELSEENAKKLLKNLFSHLEQVDVSDVKFLRLIEELKIAIKEKLCGSKVLAAGTLNNEHLDKIPSILNIEKDGERDNPKSLQTLLDSDQLNSLEDVVPSWVNIATGLGAMRHAAQKF